MAYKNKTQQLFDEVRSHRLSAFAHTIDQLQEKKTTLETEEQEIDQLRRQNAKLRQELGAHPLCLLCESDAVIDRQGGLRSHG